MVRKVSVSSEMMNIAGLLYSFYIHYIHANVGIWLLGNDAIHRKISVCKDKVVLSSILYNTYSLSVFNLLAEYNYVSMKSI